MNELADGTARGAGHGLDDDTGLAVRRYLQGLPSAHPPPALGTRLLRRHRLRRQRPLWLAAAALLVAALMLPMLAGSPDPVGMRLAADPDMLREIRALDRDLQSAYQERQPDAAVDALWQARRAVLARIDDPQATSPRPVRL
jgi:hypothetical protein